MPAGPLSALDGSLKPRAPGGPRGAHPMYCSGWLWWMTILQVGQVLFSSRYLTRQLRQTAGRGRVTCAALPPPVGRTPAATRGDEEQQRPGRARGQCCAGPRARGTFFVHQDFSENNINHFI